MKKYLLLAFMLVMTMSLAAQTYNNPRQNSNNKRFKCIKVERTSKSTILYMKYTMPEGVSSWSMIEAYPTLTDEATGKRYQAKNALNFQWGKKYSSTATYKIEFPPLPKNTSVVTFREKAGVQNPFIISNIALPIQQQKTSTSTKQNNKSNSNNNGKTIIINVN